MSTSSARSACSPDAVKAGRLATRRPAPGRQMALPRHGVRATLATVAGVGLYALAVWTPQGRVADQMLLALIARLAGTPGESLTATLAGWLREALPIVLLGVVAGLTVLAVIERRWRSLLGATLAAAASVVASPVLRDIVLARPQIADGTGYVHNTFPSTHVTVVAALCLVALWLRPAAWDRTATLRLTGAVVGLAALASVATHAHRPSDVVGSVLLVIALGSAAAWLGAASDRRPARAHRS